jgi:hypothetical protein
MKNYLLNWKAGLKMKTQQSITDFWKDYEVKIGEHVLAFALGQYIRGWEGFNNSLWGLLIATDGGFRFHHFPQEGWLGAMSRSINGAEAPAEKTIYIPKTCIISAGFYQEKSWWKSLLFSRQPMLNIRYRNAEGAECELLAETNKDAAPVAAALQKL